MLNRHMVNLGFGWIAATLVWAMTSTSAMAQGCCGGGGHDHGAAHDDSHGGHSECHLPNGGLPPLAQRTPHGGLFLEAGSNSLEVVYLPQETRVYLYGKSRQPLSARELRAQMSMKLPGETGIRQLALQYVAQPAGSKDQDYLAAAVDVTEVSDETPIKFHFENLPDRAHSKAEFTPFFHQSEIRPYVARVSFVQADREGLAQQQTCPVTGARLGSMGDPIKVLVGDRPLYLCCAGCIDKVKETPDNAPVRLPPVVGR
ncbi:MAG: hypothetical protein ACYC35_03295 [Pirellulales bacterium]